MCQDFWYSPSCCASAWERWQEKAMVSSAIVDQILQQWELVLLPQCGTEQLQCSQHVISYWREATIEECSIRMCVFFVQLRHSLDVAVFLVGAGDFFHASFSIKHLWNKINIFSYSLVFHSFFKKRILSIWLLIESHCLISHVWSDLFLCFLPNEITANSLFIESRHKDPVVESQEVTFFENLLKSSDLAYI